MVAIAFGALAPGARAASRTPLKGTLDCTNAVNIACNSTVQGDNSTGVNSVSLYPCADPDFNDHSGPEIVYRLVLTDPSRVVIELNPLTGADLDLFLLSDCNENACIGVSSAFPQPEIIATCLQAGTYYIVVEGFEGAAGPYTLTVSCSECAGTPINETCATPTPLGCGVIDTVITNTTGAVNDYNQTSGCTDPANPQSTGPDIVYSLTIPPGGSANLTFTETNYDGSFYLVTDCNNVSATCLAGDDCFPNPCDNFINYTNTTANPIQAFLIVDGFNNIAQGVGRLFGTIDCVPPEQVFGACCNRVTGGCSVIGNLDCAGLDGLFQGEGTTCSPSPCPPAESPCVLPGLSVTPDPTGDFDPQVGSPQTDIQRVSIAEPYAGGARELVWTMKVAQLPADASALPLNTLWTVVWKNPVAEQFPFHYVQMTTCDPTASPTFAYGHVEPVQGGTLQSQDGITTGSFSTDGTITIRIDPALVGDPPVGAALDSISGETRLLAGAACAGSIQPIDDAGGTQQYTLRGNDYCTPHTVSCPADFVGMPGDHLLSFDVVNPSTTNRRFSVSLADDNGWLVDGPFDDALVVPAGQTGTFSAVLRMPGNCEPDSLDPIHWQVRAGDLPEPANLQQCQTVATCRTTTGVQDGDQALSFGLLGAHPFRGEGILRYALPERSHVQIEVFSVTGQRLRTLVNREDGAGAYTVPFKLRSRGGTLASGIYLIRFTAGNEVRNLRVVALE